MGSQSSVPSSNSDQENGKPTPEDNQCTLQSEDSPLPPILKHIGKEVLPRKSSKKVRFDLGGGDPILRANEKRVRFEHTRRLETVREIDEVRYTAYGEFGRSLRR